MAPYEGLLANQVMAHKGNMRLLSYVITGHSPLNYHFFKLGLSDSPMCDKCGREEETAYHFIANCDAYCQLRNEVFGAYTLGLEDLRDLEILDLMIYAARSNRFDSGSKMRRSSQ